MNSTQITPIISPRQTTGGLFQKSAVRQHEGNMQDLDRRGQMARATDLVAGKLTNDAMEIAGALSAFEAHLITVAPLGAPRYQALADAFTMRAMNAIMRFQ